MYDLDRSAARGEMAARRLIAFKHDSALGNAPAHKLFDRVTVHRVHDGVSVPVGDKRSHNWPPARAFSDYEITLDECQPAGRRDDRAPDLIGDRAMETDTTSSPSPPCSTTCSARGSAR